MFNLYLLLCEIYINYETIHKLLLHLSPVKTFHQNSQISDECNNVEVRELDVNDMNARGFKGVLGWVRPLEFAVELWSQNAED